jgi:hypothetical protein
MSTLEHIMGKILIISGEKAGECNWNTVDWEHINVFYIVHVCVKLEKVQIIQSTH